MDLRVNSLRAAGLLVSIGLAVPSAFAQTNIPPGAIVVPSPNAPTIQAAIQSLPNGGTVFIQPGVYRESLLIDGRQIVLRGSGRDTVIRGVDAESGVVTYARGGGGAIERLTLKGGAFGVHAEDPLSDDVPEPPTNTDTNPNGLPGNISIPLPGPVAVRGPLAVVAIRDSRITKTGVGVFGSFRGLEMAGSEVLDSRLHGISVEVTDTLLFDGLDVRNNEGYGLVVYNLKPSPSGGTTRVIRNSKFFENRGGGVYIRGGALPFDLSNNIFHKNSVSALTLYGAHHTHIDFNYFLQTFAGTGTPGWGDGVRNLASRDVLVEYSEFSLNDRAAVSIIGCGDGREANTSLRHARISKNGLEINIEPAGLLGCAIPQSTEMITDLGGNNCGTKSCAAVSSVLEPVKAPIPAVP
jgi:hypothetical protein